MTVRSDNILLLAVWSKHAVIAVVQTGKAHRHGCLYCGYCRRDGMHIAD